MRRPVIAVAVGAALAASVAAGVVFAPAALGVYPTDDALAQAADAARNGRVAVIQAQTMNRTVADSDVPMQEDDVRSVDLADLTRDVAALSDTQDLTAEQVSDLTADVILGTVVAQSKTYELHDVLTAAEEAERARIKAEQERIAAEKAAEEARQRAAALAAANTPDGARATARQMAADRYGWGDGQFSCLSKLWQKESGWNYQAYNRNGGATGIPQALPGSKMATAGADWRENAATQISWGLDYIKRAYGAPCAAWGHSQSVNWY